MKRLRLGGAGLQFLVLTLTVVALAACLGAYAASSRLLARADAAATRLLVQVIAPDGPDSVAAVVRRLGGLPDVRSAAPVSPVRAAALLSAASGARIDPATLPDLRLVEVRRTPSPGGAVRIARSLETAGFKVEIYSAAQDPAPARRTSATIWLVAGGLAAGIAAALFVALSAAARRQPEPALAAQEGVARAQVLAAYGRAGAEFGFNAGLGSVIVCALSAPAVSALLDGATFMSLSANTLLGSLSGVEIALCLLAPLAAALAACLGARSGAGARYDAADLLG